jgi:hypothetical protein
LLFTGKVGWQLIQELRIIFIAALYLSVSHGDQVGLAGGTRDSLYEDWAELLGVEMASKRVITVNVFERILFI